jgi:hypothetical protein
MPEAFGQKQATKMNRSLADDPQALDWDAHVRRVQQDGALKAVRRTMNPNMAGEVKTLIDKVSR